MREKRRHKKRKLLLETNSTVEKRVKRMPDPTVKTTRAVKVSSSQSANMNVI